MLLNEDLQEMRRRHHQERLLHAYGFEPLLPDGRELWIRTGAQTPELYTRTRAVVEALREAAPLFVVRLTRCNDVSSTDERGV